MSELLLTKFHVRSQYDLLQNDKSNEKRLDWKTVAENIFQFIFLWQTL